MAHQAASQYREQLPTRPRLTIGLIFNVAAGLASILGLIYIIWQGSSDKQALVTGLYILLLNATLIILFVVQQQSKLRRYAQAVYYVHYVNHLVRDIVAAYQRNQTPARRDDVVDILDGISDCFGILTGIRCRVSIKELRADLSISTFARNSTSMTTSPRERDEPKHELSKNTDFSNLWYAKNGCSRYYLCNNLISEVKSQRYHNSSFETYGGVPEVRTFLGFFTTLSHWPLPYRSTLVLPIRYVSDFDPPGTKETTTDGVRERWSYWGFLCIDSNSRSTFDRRYMPELAAAFADALYTLFQGLAFATTHFTTKGAQK